IVATVGKGMNRLVGVAARLTGALAEAGVNIRVINQGSSEMNILIGVEEQDLEKAVAAIYHAFDSWQ
ncbi:MAG TPA: ACT domain-containing protein, partial [Candidatus Hydrogenedentes bacterium]|nr:ACT domain-containing protein [Candidatus Hydrogenedentota bacterium]